MAMTAKSHRLALPIGLACIAPLTWVLLFFSNRDPFLRGACLLVSLTIGPISSLVLGLGLRKANNRKLFLWSLVVTNATIPITVIILLAYGWLSSASSSVP